MLKHGMLIILKTDFWVCVCECRCLRRSEVLIPQELELHAIVSLLMWVLQIELKFSIEQYALLTSEPSLQRPFFERFIFNYIIVFKMLKQA